MKAASLRKSKKENLANQRHSFLKYFERNYSLYLMVLPGIIVLIMFSYVPMYGVLMAFQKYYPAKGIMGSEWVGFEHFIKFFRSPYFERLLGNTFMLGILSLVFAHPMPIIVFCK